MLGVADLAQASPSPLLSGPWGPEQIDSFLTASVIPVRLATTGRSGPLVQSMWFLWRDGRLWCATQDDALIVLRLDADARCAFEVAGDLPPYQGVRGQGVAEILPGEGERVLHDLLDRYVGGKGSGLAQWLLSRVDREVAIALRPDHLTSWDYHQRMQA